MVIDMCNGMVAYEEDEYKERWIENQIVELCEIIGPCVNEHLDTYNMPWEFNTCPSACVFSLPTDYCDKHNIQLHRSAWGKEGVVDWIEDRGW